MSNPNTVLHIHAQITLFKEWGVEVLRQGKQAQASDVLEVFSLGVSLQKDFLQDSGTTFGGLVGLYLEALEEVAKNTGALLLIPAEQAEALGPEMIPWTIHSTDIYAGVAAWAQTLGIRPVDVWYSFPNPGVPPSSLLLEDGGWNLQASREDLARAGLSPWGGTWEITANLLGLFYRDHGLLDKPPVKSESMEKAIREMLLDGAAFDSDALDLISSGELSAREAAFGNFKGWAELDQILDRIVS